jgi:hypothetical protein
MSETEMTRELDQLEGKYQGAPPGFWEQSRAKLREMLHQGLKEARLFLSWLKEQFLLFWDQAGRDIVFSRIAMAMASYPHF